MTYDIQDLSRRTGVSVRRQRHHLIQPVQHELSIRKTGDGNGTIRSNISGIDYGATCSALVDEGQAVILAASPTAGSELAGWSKPACGTAATCTVTMDRAKTVNATFALIPTAPDRDRDGVPDADDAFPVGPAEWEDYPDGDGIGNNADPDDDNDGIPDADDPDPRDPMNPIPMPVLPSQGDWWAVIMGR